MVSTTRKKGDEAGEVRPEHPRYGRGVIFILGISNGYRLPFLVNFMDFGVGQGTLAQVISYSGCDPGFQKLIPSQPQLIKIIGLFEGAERKL